MHNNAKDMKYRKILVAPDSFKGCLSSAEVGRIVTHALHEHNGDIQVDVLPMTDGGDGMLGVFAQAMQARTIEVAAHDPMMRHIVAHYALTDDGTAIIETAQACGLALLIPEERNPLVATTYGVGELLAHAVRQGCRQFIVGLGGSATSDAGMGMLRALVDSFAKGGTMDDVMCGALAHCRFVLATDVDNPLCGPTGAAAVYGPQKGATPQMVEQLDRRAERFAQLSAKHCLRDRSREAGAGAAGGLGYAFMQFLGAECRGGADLLMDIVGLDSKLQQCDLVITAEGHADRQTLMGKLPWRVMQRALRHSKPTLLVAGSVSDADALLAAGFHGVVAATPTDMPLSEAMLPDVARNCIAKAVNEWINNAKL